MRRSSGTFVRHAVLGAGLVLVAASCAPAVVHVPCIAAPAGYVIPDEKWTPYARCPQPVPVVKKAGPAGGGVVPDPGPGPGPSPQPDPKPAPKPEYSAAQPDEALAVQGDEFAKADRNGAVAIESGTRIDANAR